MSSWEALWSLGWIVAGVVAVVAFEQRAGFRRLQGELWNLRGRVRLLEDANDDPGARGGPGPATHPRPEDNPL